MSVRTHGGVSQWIEGGSDSVRIDIQEYGRKGLEVAEVQVVVAAQRIGGQVGSSAEKSDVPPAGIDDRPFANSSGWKRLNERCGGGAILGVPAENVSALAPDICNESAIGGNVEGPGIFEGEDG